MERESYLNARLSELEGRLNGSSSYRTREQQLEEENKALKQQLAQQVNIDPVLAEFRNTPEYQAAKRDNFLTFLLSQSYPLWIESPVGKEFTEWEKSAFEEFKKRKNVKPASQMLAPQQSRQQSQQQQQIYYDQGGINNG